MGWSDDGFLGIRWLSMKEAMWISILAVFTGLAFWASSHFVSNMTPTTVGTVQEETYYYEEYVQKEECTRINRRTTCNTYWEYDCTANVNYTYVVDGREYQGRDWVLVTSHMDPGCKEDVETNLLPVGIGVTVYYQEDDHSKSALTDTSIDNVICSFCCGVCGALFLVTAVLRSRKHNKTKLWWTGVPPEYSE